MDGDIVGQALYLGDIQIGFDLEKKHTKSVYLRFWNFPNFPHDVKNLTLLLHDIVRSLFLYIDSFISHKCFKIWTSLFFSDYLYIIMAKCQKKWVMGKINVAGLMVEITCSAFVWSNKAVLL